MKKNLYLTIYNWRYWIFLIPLLLIMCVALLEILLRIVSRSIEWIADRISSLHLYELIDIIATFVMGKHKV